MLKFGNYHFAVRIKLIVAGRYCSTICKSLSCYILFTQIYGAIFGNKMTIADEIIITIKFYQLICILRITVNIYFVIVDIRNKNSYTTFKIIQ